MNKTKLLMFLSILSAHGTFLNAVITLKIEINDSDPRQYNYWKRLKEDGDTGKEMVEAGKAFIVIESETKTWPLSKIIGARYDEIISGTSIEIPSMLEEDSGQVHTIGYISVYAGKKIQFFIVKDDKTYIMRLKPCRLIIDNATESLNNLTDTILDKYGVIEVEEKDE